MSHQPSPSMSPAAIPEPLLTTVLVSPRASLSTLVKDTPVCSLDRSVKPAFPSVGMRRGVRRGADRTCNAPTRLSAITMGQRNKRTFTLLFRLVLLPTHG